MSSVDKHAIAAISVLAAVLLACVAIGVWMTWESNKPGTGRLCLDFDRLPVCAIGLQDDGWTVVRVGQGLLVDMSMSYRLAPGEHDRLVRAFENWKENKKKEVKP